MAMNGGSQVEQGNYWGLPIEKVLEDLHSSSNGISSEEAEGRLTTYGPNTLATQSQRTAIGLFLSQFKSPIVLILLFATIISAFVQDFLDAVIILAIVLASAVLSFVQEYAANTAAEKLKEQISLKANVVRDGKQQLVPTEEVVPGDVVLLSAGSLIPADGLVLECKDYFVDQAVLTGETFAVEKTPGAVAATASLVDRKNCLYMGTSVRSGSGKMLVVQTGARTSYGQIAKSLTLRPPETEFEAGIRRLGYLLTEVMLILVVTIFAVNVVLQKPALDSLLFSIALAVGLTPQLLPAIININLSKGSQKMAKRGVIVRHLASIENFGSMDILCTDKTGTLTLGVVRLDHGYDPQGEESQKVKKDAWLNSHYQSGMPNPLDDAILTSVKETDQSAEKIDEVPYDFSRKRLSIVVRENGTCRMITKGAMEKILEACEHVSQEGGDAPLNKRQLDRLQKLYAGWSEQGYRVLGVAEKRVDLKEVYNKSDETSMSFVGFLLFMDPPKPDVQKTLDLLKDLGVQLKIITGDNHLVARHTAESIGLNAPVILTGEDVDNLRDEALWHAAERTDIFAEVDPNEKERIILALKKTGHVVGYLGDGINDAPSLHSADVGISVDNAVGVAKEAADFVLLRHDLAVLEQGIREGRKTFANTLKYVFMATSANFGNMFSMAGASLLLPFLPMLPMQILLINFLTDLPEMTIANDNVDNEYIQSPHRWDIHFIRRFMLIFGPLSSIFDFATFGVLVWVLHASDKAFHTGWLIESILSACLVVFAVRSRVKITQSKPSKTMILVTLIVALTVLLLPYTPIATPLGLVPLPVKTILIIFGIVLAYFASAEFTKRWFYRRLKQAS